MKGGSQYLMFKMKINSTESHVIQKFRGNYEERKKNTAKKLKLIAQGISLGQKQVGQEDFGFHYKLSRNCLCL